jgi:hypothetical protein
MKKTLPVGISDYIRAQSEYYYVDKTLLINRRCNLFIYGAWIPGMGKRISEST